VNQDKNTHAQATNVNLIWLILLIEGLRQARTADHTAKTLSPIAIPQSMSPMRK
jgi:hypothetical protein